MLYQPIVECCTNGAWNSVSVSAHYALSGNDFSRSKNESGNELRHLPLYAAYCLDVGFLRSEL